MLHEHTARTAGKFDASVARFEVYLTTLDQGLEHRTKLDPYFNGVQFNLADVTYATSNQCLQFPGGQGEARPLEAHLK